MFQKKAGREWTWKRPNGVRKIDIDYFLTNRPDIVTDVTVINQVNIGTNNKMIMSNNKPVIEVEMINIMIKRPPRVDTTQIGSKNIEFQLELRNRFKTLQELDDTPQA